MDLQLCAALLDFGVLDFVQLGPRQVQGMLASRDYQVGEGAWVWPGSPREHSRTCLQRLVHLHY